MKEFKGPTHYVHCPSSNPEAYATFYKKPDSGYSFSACIGEIKRITGVEITPDTKHAQFSGKTWDKVKPKHKALSKSKK